MSARARRSIGYYAVAATVVAALVWPLLALAYFDTEHGVESLDVATVSAWAVPARDLVEGLVTWGSADRVYATYSQLLALMFPAVLLTAVAARRQRPAPAQRSERVGWRIALTGYGLFAAGTLTFGASVLSGDADPSGIVSGLAFLALMLPGLLLSSIGSTVLGVVFLRSGYRPRMTAWLLATSFPLFLFGNIVLGHNGFGVVMLMAAWAATGWTWRTASEPAPDVDGSQPAGSDRLAAPRR